MTTTRRRPLAGLILIAALAAVPAAAATYDIDPVHSEIGFKVRHLAISKVEGEFNDFEGTFEFVPGEPGKWSCRATIQAASIDTDNKDRDDHLRSPDFLAVEEHPTITFVSTGVKMENDTEGKLMGDLTIRGVTKPVTLDLTFNGTVTDPWGNDRAGFELAGEIDRMAFGVDWNKLLETGGLVAGKTVELELHLEGIKRK